MVTIEHFDQGRVHRMAQAIYSLGDAIGRLWLTVIGVVAAAGIVGAIAFAWNSNGDIHDLKSTVGVMQGDLKDIKDDIRDMRRNGVKPAAQP